MAILDKFPSLKRAALGLGYDNNIISHGLNEEEYLSKTDSVFRHYPEGLLTELDKFCSTLTDEEAMTLVDGEEQEMFAIMARCSQREALNHLLNALFEEDYWV